MSIERLRKSKFPWKTAPTKSLLIADSQARHIVAGSLNIPSFPGAGIKHFYEFLPTKDRFKLIIFFVGGSDFYDGFQPSSNPASKVANDIIEVANFLSERARKVFVLGIPEHDENKPSSKAVADVMEDTAARKHREKPQVAWKFRSLSTYVSGQRYFRKYKIHPKDDGLNNIKNLIKEKVMCKQYKRELHLAGNTQVNSCVCPCASWNSSH